MRTGGIHTAASELLGRPLPQKSIKGVLSAYTVGGDKRFRRMRHGIYGLVRNSR